MTTKTTIRLIAVAACAGLLAVAAFGASASAASVASGEAFIAESSVPPELVPPAGNNLIATFGATGVQIYRCNGSSWDFVEPAASLLGTAKGQHGLQTVIHFRGPSWQSTVDGSLIVGAGLRSVPVPGSIPQLLVRAVSNQGDGIFGRVTFVQRLATGGGVAPAAGPCTVGTVTGVRYRAVYRFFAPA